MSGLRSIISAKNSVSCRGAFPIEGGQQRALFLKRAVNRGCLRAVKQRALLAKRTVKQRALLAKRVV